MNPEIQRWLSEGPPDFAHAPSFPLGAWARSHAASEAGLVAQPGAPPALHLDGEPVTQREVQSAVEVARTELKNINGGKS